MNTNNKIKDIINNEFYAIERYNNHYGLQYKYNLSKQGSMFSLLNLKETLIRGLKNEDTFIARLISLINYKIKSTVYGEDVLIYAKCNNYATTRQKQEVIFLVDVLIEIQEQIKLKNTIKREIEKTIVLADKYTEA